MTAHRPRVCTEISKQRAFAICHRTLFERIGPFKGTDSAFRAAKIAGKLDQMTDAIECGIDWAIVNAGTRHQLVIGPHC